MDEVILQQLAKQLNLTNLESEKEEYILTQDEEEIVIQNEVISLKKLFAWKKANQGMKQLDILKKISEINWIAEIDTEKLLKNSNSNKLRVLWHKEQEEKRKQEEIKNQKELEKLYSSKKIYSLMSWTSKNEFDKDLIVNDDNRPLIVALCYFLSKDERFETELKYSFKKGLLIRGKSGIGKTFLVQCIKKNGLNPIYVESAIEITNIIRQKGGYNFPITNEKIIYIDDVGTEEPVVVYYGNHISFFKNYIELFYLNKKDYSSLMISTNNNFDELEQKYGFRVRSRMKEMFNIIDVTGQDMRQ